ncbi:MAG TPA: hypothetical protein PKC98_02695 [Candidatus Melainabacteria bacterium]|nr:hypothetical protein [Candidatus Melainabacteria bacterium]
MPTGKSSFLIVLIVLLSLSASGFVTAYSQERIDSGDSGDSGAPGSYIEEESSGEREASSSSLQGRADLNVDREESSGPNSGMMPPLAPPIANPQMKPIPEFAPDPDVRRGGILKNLFDLSADHSEKAMQRPSWLPAHAYSNDSMVAPYHNREYFWWDKSPMPDKPQWVVLSTSVTRFWRGFAPQPCWVLVSPNPLAPGNFTFRARVANGPRGWLQALPAKSKYGFPLYRYWLDQP